jgi:hypothetical protein
MVMDDKEKLRQLELKHLEMKLFTFYEEDIIKIKEEILFDWFER